MAVSKKFESVELPDYFDWRSKGAISPVHNQGRMGFPQAEFDAIISAEFIQNGNMVDLSVEQILDCVAVDTRFYESVYKYAQKFGLESEKDYPQTAKLQKCHFDEQKVKAKVNKVVKVDANPQAIMTALLKQPASVLIDADHIVFQTYTRGILDSDLCGTEANHEMLIVGYGKFDQGNYFILKNSWGSSWGDNGYIKIKADHGKGICGMN